RYHGITSTMLQHRDTTASHLPCYSLEIPQHHICMLQHRDTTASHLPCYSTEIP
ncbi:hypothetical protein NDU88_003197, partial [Pleurodeles waltl]